MPSAAATSPSFRAHVPSYLALLMARDVSVITAAVREGVAKVQARLAFWKSVYKFEP